MNDKIGTHLFAVAADSDEQLSQKLTQLKDFLKTCQSEGSDITDAAFSVNTSPELRHLHRAVVIGKTYEELLQKLESGNEVRGVAEKIPPKLCFLFSGMGALYPGMAKQLNETSPVFRNYLDIVDEASLAGYQEVNCEDQFSTFEEIAWMEPHKLNSPRDACNAHIRLNFILTKMWEYWGILPDVVLGASLGEFIAAHAAGIVRLHDAIRTASGISELIKYCAEGGMMAIGAGDKAAQVLVDGFNSTAAGPDIWAELANVNGSYQSVVSVSKAALPLFRDYCTEKNVKSTLLPIPSAFHCRAVDPGIPIFVEMIGRIETHFQRIEYVSSQTGEIIDTQIDGKVYWTKVIREKVQFQKACLAAYNSGARVFLEVGTHPILSALMVMNVDELDDREPITCFPTLQKGMDDWTTLMTTFGTLYTMGYSSNWHALYVSYSPKRLPTPFDKVTITKQLIGPSEIWGASDGDTRGTLNQDVVTYIMIEEFKKILLKSGREVGDLIRASSNFSELGLSSLQVVLMKNQMQAMLGKNIQLKFSDFLDCTNVSELSRRICAKIEATAQGLERQRELEDIAKTKALILRDMKLPKHITLPPVNTIQLKKLKTFLVTGVTGNLCPFLVEWLLLKRNKQTERLYCLVRGKNGRERMIEKFKFLEINDSIDLNKITIIEGDVTQLRFGLEQETYDKLADECDAIINSAACTNHLAKYRDDNDRSGPRVVNIESTIRVLEFACHKRAKWLYNASTGMASTGTKGVYYEKAVEEWPHKGFEEILDHGPNVGYMISKVISDYMVFKASQRGIPAKVFRFPKIGNCKDVTTNHFIAKFLHFLLSGTLPQFDIPLQILSVRDCANISMRTFFNKEAAATDIYNLVSPYDISEMDLISVGKELGPRLRFMVEAVRVNNEAFGPDKPEVLARKDKLLATMKFLDGKYGKEWIDSPEAALEDPAVIKLLKEEYHLKMRFVEYNLFKDKLESDGLRSPLYPWLEFYVAGNSVYSKIHQRDLPEELGFPFLKHGMTAPETILRNMKLERLYPGEIFDMVENPIQVVRKDIEFAISSANKLFQYPF